MKLINYISEEIKRNQILGYTCEYSEQAKQIENKETILSAEAHSKMSEMDFTDIFTSKERLIRWYFGYLSNMKKLDAVGKVGQIIKDKNIGSVISFGSGPCVLEYFISLISRGGGVKIVVTDYDEFMIKKASELLKSDGFLIEKFDFYHDDATEMIKKYSAEAVVMFGSACSMDNKKYLDFLKILRMTNIKYVITFEAGIMDNFHYSQKKIITVLKAIKRYLCRQERKRRKALHAYIRSEKELTNIFRQSGFAYERMKKFDTYKYAYILTNI